MITAVPVTGYAARITLVQGPGWAGHTMTISRVTNGVETPIIAGRNIPASSGVWDDPEIPLNVPSSYRVASSDGSIVELSALVRVPAARAVVSDPWRGLTAEVVIVTEGDREHDSRTSRIDVAGRADRVRVWDVEAAARIQPELITDTAEDLATLNLAMASGDPVLVRCVCGEHGGWWQRVGGRTEARVTFGGRGRRHSLSDVDVLPVAPSDVRPVGDTLGDLHAYMTDRFGPTLGDIEDTGWVTLGDIAAADLRGLL